MRHRRPHLSLMLSMHLARLALMAGFIAMSAAAQDAGRYEQTDIQYGATLYSMHCITCHGENGDLLPQINLRSGAFPNSPSDRDLGDNIRNGLPGTAMIPTEYSDSEITALVAYVRNIGNFDLGSVTLGDPESGQALFEGKGDCASCHRVYGRGPRFAPDLSNIGAIRTAAQLERSLLGAEGGLIPINRPVRIVTQDGSTINGRRLNEDRYTVQLVDERERLLSLDKSDLREYTILTTSTMPAYDELLTDAERADLLAYMLTLKGFN
jgi:putative heme-binding domain-containing protein